MTLSMPRLIDIRVRRGRARQHRISNALDALKAAGGPVTLRLTVEAYLPRRAAGRREAREYQRITSYLIDCRRPEAVRHVFLSLREIMRQLDRTAPAVPEERLAPAPAAQPQELEAPDTLSATISVPVRPQEPRPSSLCQYCGRPPGENSLGCFACMDALRRSSSRF